jgi:cobalt/nickel transport system permease protein
MHIPDGYLSPTTCATLFAGAAPFWYTSLRRMKKALHTRTVPLISVFAAFSFIVMMFNLPLPGGTTGHAMGVGVAAIALGPWASILAISTAIAVQAIFFADGGITALGANCFNMAIMGSLSAWAIYRLVSGTAPLRSTRRIVAAGLAGYVSINLGALLAAIELGVQPMLFHDASGTPLYAPYPLGVAIPAMMIGHMAVAGIAELIVTAGIVAWLQKAEPQLLRATAPGAQGEGVAETLAPRVRSLRPLWTALAALMILTPLGIVAAGSAWGEWSPEAFSSQQSRREIAASSSNVAPPSRAPEGLRKLSDFWTAPIPRYAPAAIKSPQLGYILSAMTGAGLIIFLSLGLGRLFGGRTP